MGALKKAEGKNKKWKKLVIFIFLFPVQGQEEEKGLRSLVCGEHDRVMAVHFLKKMLQISNACMKIILK